MIKHRIKSFFQNFDNNNYLYIVYSLFPTIGAVLRSSFSVDNTAKNVFVYLHCDVIPFYLQILKFYALEYHLGGS